MTKRIAIARETLEILNAGYYISPTGKKVEIEREFKACLAQTRCYDPETLSQLEREVLSRPATFANTAFEVYNETTLMGAERLARSPSSSQKFQKIGVLNFASAKNPGGGFLNGAQAQEESLARSSGLYKSLVRCPEYYDFHRSAKSLLYSNRIVCSPGCPVFRKDDGTLLENPYFVDFITSPAPNAGAISRNKPQDLEKIPEVLRDRGAKVLSLAAYSGCDALVLGAWGCGVFRNDPAEVSQTFADFLLPNHPFWGRFQLVLFSVLDSTRSQNTFKSFQAKFAGDRNLQ
ncbi:TIGR02452 family protein [Baaleninema simplex]|uniref:TIGR02452 family protein n=1 Tax=Baaleninema simplex TaxID=2862350 RepID=UPI0003455736|nr:TIGR02452 family protein [Baaleninema simplex]